MSDEKTFRSFLGILYPDSESYDCEAVLERLQAFFPMFAYCLHDQDVKVNGELKKPHYHWVGQRSACTLSFVASSCEIPVNMIEPCRRFKKSIRYLIHADDLDKAKYEQDSIVTTFDLTKYFQEDYELQALDAICDFLYSPKCTNFYSLFAYCCNNGYLSVYRRNLSSLKIFYNEKRSYFSEIHNS